MVTYSYVKSQLQVYDKELKIKLYGANTYSNTHFQFLNNITCIFIHFFINTYFHTYFQTTKYIFSNACTKHPSSFNINKCRLHFTITGTCIYFSRKKKKKVYMHRYLRSSLTKTLKLKDIVYNTTVTMTYEGTQICKTN